MNVTTFIIDIYKLCWYNVTYFILSTLLRGSFNIGGNDYELFEGIFAHLSNKACDRVSNEANMMPSVLDIEIKPKTLLWPKRFEECELSDNNIALYFFPGFPE